LNCSLLLFRRDLCGAAREAEFENVSFCVQGVYCWSCRFAQVGMQAVADQLDEKAQQLGVNIQCGWSVESIHQSDGKFAMNAKSYEEIIQLQAKSIVLATNEKVAHNLLCNTVKQVQVVPELSQRTVASLYYSLPSPPPLLEPILVLNGDGNQQCNTKRFPINNVCFPSVVQARYSPRGYKLCSVSVLEIALNEYNGDYEALDCDVRNQLSIWFPNDASDIMDATNAQPSHYNEPCCANVHGGQDCESFHAVTLPKGMFVSGDYMAMSTFNGALESEVNAGRAASTFLSTN
jgi:phytoene dehydrogenase-like protein